MDEKIGTELNIALNTPEDIRTKSLDLNTGYDKELDVWELIIKYTGDIDEIASEYNSLATKLLGGFGIISISEDAILELARDSRIIYIEKPKKFIESRTSINGFVSSCMSVPYFELNLKGNGMTVAIIDSGIDIFHDEFIDIINDMDSSINVSKIIGLWDQTIYGNPPNNYNIGSYFPNEEINSALNVVNGEITFDSVDITGHGTAVAGIVSACVPEAKLLIVKLDTKDKDEIDTINLMQGIDFAVRYSIDNNLPMVVNLSYGNNSGDHNGNSVLERYIDQVSQLSKLTFVIGTGNDGVAGNHVQFNIDEEKIYRSEFVVPEGEGGISIQIWRDYQEQMDVSISTPSGDVIGPFYEYQKLMNYNVGNMDIRVLNNGPTPINKAYETYISIIPLNNYLEGGIWSIDINPGSIVNGRVDIWLPVEGSTNTDVYFLNPSEGATLTIPSTSINSISVGAYDSNTMSYASFSGRGFTVDGLIKPDIVAPGVNIDVPSVGGGYNIVSGTSFATPFVASGAVMLMQYGIIDGNDPFLYGEKVKAYLILGAFSLPGIDTVPDPRIGWGALCVENSLPI